MKIKEKLKWFLIGIIAILLFVTSLVGVLISEEDLLFKNVFITIITFFFVIIELVCFYFVYTLSRTISNSIMFLQKSTDKIARGELDTPIEPKVAPRGDNEISNLIENLDKMRRTLKEEREREQRFVMGLSHDLRTPVAVIKGYAEAINDGVVTEADEVKKSIEVILSNTNHLEDMIGTLINFVKIERTGWEKTIIRQPIAPVLREFTNLSLQTGELFKRKVKGIIEISDETEIAFNKELFIRALENLYSNAIRYSKEGDSITIEAKESDSKIILKIADTGAGIDSKDIQFVFDIFYRGTNSRREEGMGLGLFIVKYVIDTFKWTIDVQSQKGVGTVFTITIPKTNSKKESRA